MGNNSTKFNSTKFGTSQNVPLGNTCGTDPSWNGCSTGLSCILTSTNTNTMSIGSTSIGGATTYTNTIEGIGSCQGPNPGITGGSNPKWINVTGNITTVTPYSSATSSNTDPFIKVSLADLFNNGLAQILWSSQNGSQCWSAVRILTKATDPYIATGHVILPMCCNYGAPYSGATLAYNPTLNTYNCGQNIPYPSPVPVTTVSGNTTTIDYTKSFTLPFACNPTDIIGGCMNGGINGWNPYPLPNNCYVLLVKNNPTYCKVINPSDWVYQMNDNGSGNFNHLYFYTINNRTNYAGYTLLGEMLGNNNTNNITSMPDTSCCAVAAISNKYIVTSSIYPDSTAESALYLGNDANLGFSGNLNWIARSSPYANYYTNGGGSNQTQPYTFSDVITNPMIEECCSPIVGGTPTNTCGSSTRNGTLNTYSSGSSGCLNYVESTCANNMDSFCSSFIASKPGQYDALVNSFCSITGNLSNPLCACYIPMVYDNAVPEATQQLYNANPQCFNSQCANPNAYQWATIYDKTCDINIENCITTSYITNNGVINGNVSVVNSPTCLQYSNSTGTTSPSNPTGTGGVISNPTGTGGVISNPTGTSSITSSYNSLSRNEKIGLFIGIGIFVLLIFILIIYVMYVS